MVCLLSVCPFAQWCTNASRQVAWTMKLCTVVPNMCDPLVWNLLHVALLVPRILRWLLYFWEVYVPLHLPYTGEREVPVNQCKKDVALCWNRVSLVLRKLQVAYANPAT